MLAQFHDCIPGTTIRGAVDDNLEIYAKRSAQAKGLIGIALKSLSAASGCSVIDPLRLKRDHVFEYEGRLGWLSTDVYGQGQLVDRQDVSEPRARSEGDRHILSNSRFKLTIDQGRICSIFDLAADRELIEAGPGVDDAGLLLYEDYPLTYDAWDAEIYHLQSYSTLRFDSVTVKEDPLRASLIGEVSFGKSSATVTVS